MKVWWLVAASLVASSALAQQQGPGKFYVGLDVGQSRIEAESGEFLYPADDIQHGTDVGFKALFGIQISRYFAVEAGYTHFGSFDARNIPYTCGAGSPPPCTYDVSASTHGPFTDLVGLWPFAEHWSASVRAGVQYAQSSLKAHDPDVPASTTDHDESSFGFLYGVGVNYQLNERMRVRLNWEQNDQLALGLNLGGGVGFYELGSARLISLGLDYRL
jgi:opacity protein-like surface antigen